MGLSLLLPRIKHYRLSLLLFPSQCVCQSLSMDHPRVCIIAHSLRTNACCTPLSLAALPVNMCILIGAWRQQLHPWREAAFCICMALSGVTCSPPPPPSATIEAIEALEPHDEDREGKPTTPLNIRVRVSCYSGQVPQSAHTEITPSSKISQDRAGINVDSIFKIKLM